MFVMVLDKNKLQVYVGHRGARDPIFLLPECAPTDHANPPEVTTVRTTVSFQHIPPFLGMFLRSARLSVYRTLCE